MKRGISIWKPVSSWTSCHNWDYFLKGVHTSPALWVLESCHLRSILIFQPEGKSACSFPQMLVGSHPLCHILGNIWFKEDVAIMQLFLSLFWECLPLRHDLMWYECRAGRVPFIPLHRPVSSEAWISSYGKNTVIHSTHVCTNSSLSFSRLPDWEQSAKSQIWFLC